MMKLSREGITLKGNKQFSDHDRQKRQVSKVLLDGLYDPDSPLSMLLGVRTNVMGEIIWQVGK